MWASTQVSASSTWTRAPTPLLGPPCRSRDWLADVALTQLTSQAPRALPQSAWSGALLWAHRSSSVSPSIHTSSEEAAGCSPTRHVISQPSAPHLPPALLAPAELVSAAPSAVALQSCPAALRQASPEGALGSGFPRSSPQGNPSFHEHAAQKVPSPPLPQRRSHRHVSGKGACSSIMLRPH